MSNATKGQDSNVQDRAYLPCFSETVGLKSVALFFFQTGLILP